MISIVIQIGNSDNKLTQSEWAHFCENFKLAISDSVHNIHFQGGSDWNAPWQNACWVCEILVNRVDSLKEKLTKLRAEFRQDSIAFIIGKTEFI